MPYYDFLKTTELVNALVASRYIREKLREVKKKYPDVKDMDLYVERDERGSVYVFARPRKFLPKEEFKKYARKYGYVYKKGFKIEKLGGKQASYLQTYIKIARLSDAKPWETEKILRYASEGLKYHIKKDPEKAKKLGKLVRVYTEKIYGLKIRVGKIIPKTPSKTSKTKKKASKKKKTKRKRGKPHQTGTSNLLRDSYFKAKPPGRRVSKSGKIYYEYRRNRSDLTPEEWARVGKRKKKKKSKKKK